jgi:hypothetical protein
LLTIEFFNNVNIFLIMLTFKTFKLTHNLANFVQAKLLVFKACPYGKNSEGVRHPPFETKKHLAKKIAQKVASSLKNFRTKQIKLD